uniref:RBR-type E3 ubiquitin transferase n=2 Tax=Kalanchoe fedtschenkoi TaxID=63787 RepID=A0A7N0V0S5_KALFE
MADDGDDEFYDGGDDDYDGYEEEGDSEGFVVSDDDDDDCIAAAAARDEADVKVITKESLLAAQKADLQRVMDLFSLREHHARTLLIHFRWDVHKLISVFVENGADRLYSLVGIVLPKDFPSSVSDLSTVGCQICFEEKMSSEVTMMDCGHYFCKGCWAEYFIVQIQGGLSKRIRCMACKCNAICDEEKIRDLVSFNYGIAKKFENSLLESYIEDNDKVKWCPSIPHCGNAISVESDGVCEVKCTCGLEFCFGCLSEGHSPCSCFMWRLWVKKCSDDSETSKWVTENTKPCPKCFKPVAKDGGCNHVTCVCGQSMCWLCGGPTGRSHTYESIEGHSCGRYKKEDGEQKNTERARRRLWRYTHYFSHYTAHKDSLKLESAKEKIMHRISKLENLEYESRDYSWLLDGFNRLSRARRILAYSYPFAYYMFGDELFAKEMTESDKAIKQELFESQQQQFAGMVEKLSQALEEKIDDKPTEDKIKQVRRTVLDLSLLTDGLCKKMYSCIENDLLGPLSTGTLHQIAAYQSKGVKKASEFCISFQAIST